GECRACKHRRHPQQHEVRIARFAGCHAHSLRTEKQSRIVTMPVRRRSDCPECRLSPKYKPKAGSIGASTLEKRPNRPETRICGRQSRGWFCVLLVCEGRDSRMPNHRSSGILLLAVLMFV